MILPFHFEVDTAFNSFKDSINYWYLCNGKNGTPNLINRFIYGGGPEGGKDYRDTCGSETVTLTVNQLPNHYHILDINGEGNHGNRGPCGESRCNGGGRMNTMTTSCGQAHNNMPPFIRMGYFIYLPPELF